MEKLTIDGGAHSLFMALLMAWGLVLFYLGAVRGWIRRSRERRRYRRTPPPVIWSSGLRRSLREEERRRP